MSNQTDQLWAVLQENGLVQGEPPERGVSGSPWYVKVLIAFSGWLAAIFIFGFIGVTFEFVFKSSSVACVVGIFMIGGAFTLLRIPSNDFVEHLGLAVSMAGQALITYAIFGIYGHNKVVAWLLLAALQCALVAFMPNFIHGVFSSLIAVIVFSMALNEMDIPNFIGGVVIFGASFCWLNEFHYPQHMKKIRAIGYGLVLALIVLESMVIFGYRAFGDRLLQDYHGFLTYPWLGEGIIGAVSVYIVWGLLRRYGQPMNGRLSMTTLLATLFLCAVSMNVQGITVGMVIVCFGFFGTNRVLLGLGIVSLLFYISSYYYLLDTTLLSKSQSLLMVGLVLLCIRWLMHRIIPVQNEVRHE